MYYDLDLVSLQVVVAFCRYHLNLFENIYSYFLNQFIQFHLSPNKIVISHFLILKGVILILRSKVQNFVSQETVIENRVCKNVGHCYYSVKALS